MTAAPLPLVPVADIKAILTGKECPHMKEKGALKQNKVRASQGVTPPHPRASAQGQRGGKREAWPPLTWSLASLPIPKEALELAFSILYDPDEALNFIAPNKYEVSQRERMGEPRAAQSPPALHWAGQPSLPKRLLPQGWEGAAVRRGLRLEGPPGLTLQRVGIKASPRHTP